MTQLTIYSPVTVESKIVEGAINLQRISELKKQISSYEKELKAINTELVKAHRSGSRVIKQDDDGNLVDDNGVILHQLMETTTNLNQQIPIHFELPE